MANPAAYGFAANATATDYCTQYGATHVCNGGGANKVSAQTTAQILSEGQHLYIYAHPTTALAGLMAEGDASVLAVPEPSSLGLLGLDLLAIAAITIKRRCQP